MPGDIVRVIVIEGVSGLEGNRRVRVEPDPGDGSRCTETFRDHEAAAHFAWQLRRARGWRIVNRADRPQAARQARDG